MFNTSNISLNPDELNRYSRHTILSEIGVEGQKKLKSAKVLVIGAGGLGCPNLQYLAAAGVGTIGIVDHDVVSESNLQRQTLYTSNDLGKLKVEVAKERLLALNKHININIYPVALSSSNALEILKEYDIVADGTDNFATRYLINDACLLTNSINVFASISKFNGQLTVFNYPSTEDRAVNYRDVFPTPPAPGTVPSCAEAGVIGVLPGILGSLQANEIIKIITGVGQPLYGQLLTFDALSLETFKITLSLDPDFKMITELIDYEIFCGNENKQNINTISVIEFEQLKSNGDDFELIDVREPFEFDIANLGGKLIPLSEIENRISELPTNKKLIVHCKMGGRSLKAIEILEKHGFRMCYNLEGGINEYAKTVNQNIPIY